MDKLDKVAGASMFLAGSVAIIGWTNTNTINVLTVGIVILLFYGAIRLIKR